MKKTNGIKERNSAGRKHGRRAAIALLMLLALVAAQFSSSGLTASVLAADEEEAVETETETKEEALTIEIDDDAITEATEAEDETPVVVTEEAEDDAEAEAVSVLAAEDEAEEAEEDSAQADIVSYQKTNDDVTVTVEAPEGALPDGAELKVERFAEDSDDYKEAAKAIGYEEADGGMAALDISFTVDGKEVEPGEAVKVSIDVSQILPDDADASSIEVQHIEENLFGLVKNAVVVANESEETEGTIDEEEATAEFEVESFSTFTVSWTLTEGPTAGTSYSVTITAYLDGNELEGISDLTFNSENDELDFETLLSDENYGTGDYTFSYAIVTANNVTYGSVNNPVVAIEIDQGTGGPTSTTNFLLVYADGTTGTVSTNNVSVAAYYVTPEFGVTIEAAGEDEETEAWVLQAVLSHAGDYQSISYEWTITNNDGSDNVYANVTNTDNTGRAYISWASGVVDNTEVTVSVKVTLTLEDGTTATATADYVLEYGDETVDLIMTYGPDKTPLPAGVTVTLTSASGTEYSGTTSDDGWVHNLEIEPGIYTVTATYNDGTNTYQCSETVAMHDAGNYSINLNYYNPEILTDVPERSNWEHIDIKLSVGTTSNSSSGTVSVNITGAQIVGSDEQVKYTATEESITGNDNEFQLLFYEGTETTGEPTHSIEFDTTDTIYITYVLTIDGEEQAPVTIAISSSTTYDEGTTYPVTGQRAYKLYNYLYGTSYSSDAQLIADGIGDIDISGMSMMLVAAILCDSSEVTGAGQVEAVSGQSANQWGMDFALSIEAMNELAASWAFNIEKTYENASMTAGDFVFYLYNATVTDGTWSLGDLQSTLTNQTAGMDLEGNSRDTMELFSIAYSDEAIQAGETYYYILYEEPDTVTSGSGATITFDGTVFGVMVQLGTDEETGEATVTATYYKMVQDGDTYEIEETYETGTSVEGKITFDSDDYATFEFTNSYQNYTEISGSKTWVDNNNEYNTRPDSITINLLVNGEQAYDDDEQAITATVTASDNWSWSFTDLPMYDGVTELTYTVAEITVPGYTTTYDDDGNPVNTLTGETQISVEKVWANDSDNKYETRPDSITVTITGSDENTYTLTLNEGNSWSGTQSELPLYDSTGTEITYTVSEETVNGYTGSVVDNGDGSYTITNTLQTVAVSGSKTWVNDSEDDRPDSITIYIYADDGDEPIDSVTVTADDDWEWKIENLPKYQSDGKTEIEYTVLEDDEAFTSSGYIPSYDGTDVTNALPKIEKDVSDPTYGESTDDNLHQDEADNNDTLEYKMEADHIGGAHNLVLHDYLDDQLDITSLVIKSVTLYIDENDEGRELVEDTDYTVSYGECSADCGLDGCSFEIHIIDEDIENLSSDAYVIVIFDIDVKEGVEDFDSSYTDEIDNYAGLSYEVRNVYTYADPDETETYSYGFDLYKYDGDTNDPLEGAEFVMSNSDGKYAQFEVTDETYLLSAWADGKDDATTIISGSDGQAIVEGLHDGTFKIEETKAPDGYQRIKGNMTVTITVDEDDPKNPIISATGATYEDGEVKVENTVGEDLITIVGSKTWDDGDDADGIRPDSITINVLDDPDGDPVATQTVTADDNWAWSFKDLPEYDSDGNEINYIITEAEIDGYTYSVDGYDVTNTHEYETRDISGSKTWEDDDDKADARPTSITVNLYQDGDLYDSLTVTEDDDWTWSWIDLPKNKDGEAIAYTITEDEVDDYTTTYYSGSFDITNTFEGEEEEGPDEGGDVPKTGDNNSLLIWALAMLLCVLSAGEVYLVKRRRK